MVLMFAYVALGGIIGAGMGGVVKTILLYILTITCIFVTIRLTGEIGPGTKLDVDIHDLFARGVAKELFNGLALILGIISTQSYAQAFWVAKNYHVARKGALIGALLCLPVGFGSVLVGIFMKNHNLANAGGSLSDFPASLYESAYRRVGAWSTDYHGCDRRRRTGAWGFDDFSQRYFRQTK